MLMKSWRSFALACVVLAISSPASADVRSIDGSSNNLANPSWGQAGTQLLRTTTVGYGDLVWTPAGANRPSPREVSNAVCDQAASVPNSAGVTDFVWQWGQFLDHDIDLTELAEPSQHFDIEVPAGDLFFDPNSTGTQVIFLERSIFDPATGNALGNPRQQLNGITAFIDGSNVYGSDPVRAAALRKLDGSGRLATSQHNLLPFNAAGLPNAGGTSPTLFLAGDVRANEQLGLTVMHTLFVREHNRLARQIRRADRSLSGDEIYELARAKVGALLQAITYNEFLPALLGPNGLSTYAGYNPSVNPSIRNLFSTASYRFGHTMLNAHLLRLKRNGQPIPNGHLALRDAFFAPQELTPSAGHGLSPILRGLATQPAQEIDAKIIDDVRNFLFGQPGQGGFDLASLNMQRGRDHGLPSYNQARIDVGLAPALSFADVTSDPALQQQLASVYASVEDIDAWIGGLSEDHVSGALVGELIFTVLKSQFEALRDGDRFWYQNVFSGAELQEIEDTTLADIIRRNTKIKREIQDNVFLVAP